VNRLWFEEIEGFGRKRFKKW